jgi:hypothetical protein
LIGGASVDVPAAGNGNMLNIGGMIIANLSTLAAPSSFAGCGTGAAVDAHANNRSGTLTIGTGTVTSCAMTLAGSGYASWSHCRVTPHSTLAAFAYSYTTTVITITGTALASAVVDYECDGY